MKLCPFLHRVICVWCRFYFLRDIDELGERYWRLNIFILILLHFFILFFFLSCLHFLLHKDSLLARIDKSFLSEVFQVLKRKEIPYAFWRRWNHSIKLKDLSFWAFNFFLRIFFNCAFAFRQIFLILIRRILVRGILVFFFLIFCL